MCGFVGVFGANASDPCLDAMFATVGRRGPDEQGSATFPEFSVAFGRLAIVDIEIGQQPAVDRASKIAVVLAGEIYNTKGICAEFQFPTDLPEAQMLLALYRRIGQQFLRCLEGEYSIAVFDGVKNTCFVARDASGVRPLYYAITGQAGNRNFVFSTHLDAFFLHPQFCTELDDISFVEQRVLGFWSAERTAFSQIKSLPPGGSAIVRQGFLIEVLKDPAEDAEAYGVDAIASVDDDVVDEFIAELSASVQGRIRHIDRSQVCVSLSGGIDSSLVLALAARNSSVEGVNLHAVTFHDGGASDDAESAAAVAAHFDVRSSLLKTDMPDFLSYFARLVRAMATPGPSYSSFAAGQLLHRQMPDMRVLLGGDGADELFLGYRVHEQPRLYMERVTQRIAGLPDEIVAASSLFQTIARWRTMKLADAWLELVQIFRSDQLATGQLQHCDHGFIDHRIEYRVPFLSTRVRRFALGRFDALKSLGPGRKVLLKLALARLIGDEHPLGRQLLARRKMAAPAMISRTRALLRQTLATGPASYRPQNGPVPDGVNDVEASFWCACLRVIFLQHKGRVDGMTFSDLVHASNALR